MLDCRTYLPAPVLGSAFDPVLAFETRVAFDSIFSFVLDCRTDSLVPVLRPAFAFVLGFRTGFSSSLVWSLSDVLGSVLDLAFVLVLDCRIDSPSSLVYFPLDAGARP